ncbi:unnamed protein product [Symbiodinium sp. KB8]|nr:unnamed protein product [Symbiodinium sp. KB8]
MKHWHSTGNCDRKLITSDRSAWCLTTSIGNWKKTCKRKRRIWLMSLKKAIKPMRPGTELRLRLCKFKRLKPRLERSRKGF